MNELKINIRSKPQRVIEYVLTRYEPTTHFSGNDTRISCILNSAYFQNKYHLQNSISNIPQVAGSRPDLWPIPNKGLGREESGQKFTCLFGEGFREEDISLIEGQPRAVSMCSPIKTKGLYDFEEISFKS